MKKTALGILIGLVLGGATTWLVLRQIPASSAATPNAAAPAAKPDEKPNPLQLPPAKRAQCGITLAKPTAATNAPEVRGFARVLDASPLIVAVSEIETARATLGVSEKEMERTQKLFDAGGNASSQALENAKAAVLRDRAALASARTRLIATWGRDLANNLGPINDALAHGGSLVRIDVLSGDSVAAAPKQARLAMPDAADENPDFGYTADIIGAAPSVDAQIQGTSFLALVRADANADAGTSANATANVNAAKRALPVGAALRAALPAASEAAATAKAFAIPRDAVVYYQGSAWIFEFGENDTFERKLVTLGRALPGGLVTITSGLDPDEQVAATGAQQLLAAELQAGDAGGEP